LRRRRREPGMDGGTPRFGGRLGKGTKPGTPRFGGGLGKGAKPGFPDGILGKRVNILLLCERVGIL